MKEDDFVMVSGQSQIVVKKCKNHLHKHDEGHHEGVGQLPAPHRDDGPNIIDKEALLCLLVVDLVLHSTLAVHILLHELSIQSGTSQKSLHSRTV